MNDLQATVNLFQGIAKNSLRPIPKLPVSDWADSFRMISPEGASEPGRWHTDRAPYQKEIMDAFTQPGVHVVVAMNASQTGKSDIMNNVIGRFAHVDPAPIMMIQPTVDMAQDYSKRRIAPMIRDTPTLKNIFRDAETRKSGNTILSKLFPGGSLVMVGANSPAGLASRPIRILLADEVDRFPDSAGTEGDPVDLASKRMTTFYNRVMGLFSTPTNEHSRIKYEYDKGTQEEWSHQCPNCKEWHCVTPTNLFSELEASQDKKGKRHQKVTAVRWRCPDCGHSFSEFEMRQAPQKYIAHNPEALKRGIRSFKVNGFASPWLSWQMIMQEYQDAINDPEQMRTVVNTRFAEVYEPGINLGDIGKLMDRREKYEAELPEGVLLLTAAVDVQDNRLEYEIVGWGKEQECWGIKKDIILGSPDNAQTWEVLDAILDRAYCFANGTALMVARTFIDSGGHYSKEVYRYCATHMARQRFAIKGSSSHGVPIIHRYSKATVIRNKTIPLVLLGTDSGKQYIMDRLAIEVPGAKYFHYPLGMEQGYDEIYFKGLLSEQLVPRKKNGQVVWQWENIAKDKRNEPLDLRVYNFACMVSINPNFEELEEVVKGASEVEKETKKAKPQSFGKIKKVSWE